MRYGLPRELSYCHVGGHVLFWDAKGDRYFRLSGELERRFLAWIESDNQAFVDVGDLLDRRILVEATADARLSPATSATPPVRSAMEREDAAVPGEIPTTLRAVAAVFSAHHQLRTRRVVDVLDDLAAYRRQKVPASAAGGPPKDEPRLLQASARFRRARVYAPPPTRCLLDSIALVRFLAGLRLHASIVFGVTATPFSAHCWAQSGDLVLNDAVGNVNAYTPIRTV